MSTATYALDLFSEPKSLDDAMREAGAAAAEGKWLHQQSMADHGITNKAEFHAVMTGGGYKNELPQGFGVMFNKARIPIPKNARELEEMLSDPKQTQRIANAGQLSDFVQEYVRQISDTDDSIQEQVQRQLANFLKDNEDFRRVPMAGGKQTDLGTIHNKHAPGAALDGVFNHVGEYFAAALNTNKYSISTQMQKVEEISNSMSENVPSEGGFLVPEQFRSKLLQLSLGQAVVRPRATVIPMGSLRVPIPAIDETDRQTSVHGGVVAAWTEEGAKLTLTKPKFSRVVLDAKKLTTYTEAPNELVNDSALAFLAVIEATLPGAIAFFEDIAFLQGTGTGEPLGVLNAPGALSITRATAAKVKFADIIAMFSRMLPESLGSAVWVCSPAVIAQLLQLVLATGGTGNETVAPPLWLNMGNAAEAPTMSILGRPLIVTEKVPDLGTAGDIAFIDFSKYLVGDRQTMQLQTSEHFKFDTDETAYRVIERVDGRPWVQKAITPHNGGATLSPYVKLGTV